MPKETTRRPSRIARKKKRRIPLGEQLQKRLKSHAKTVGRSSSSSVARILPSRTVPEIVLVEDDTATYRKVDVKALGSADKVVVGRVTDLEDTAERDLTSNMLLAWMCILERGLTVREKDTKNTMKFAPARQGTCTSIIRSEVFRKKHGKLTQELERTEKEGRAWKRVSAAESKKAVKGKKALTINALSDVRALLKQTRCVDTVLGRGGESCLEHLTRLPVQATA